MYYCVYIWINLGYQTLAKSTLVLPVPPPLVQLLFFLKKAPKSRISNICTGCQYSLPDNVYTRNWSCACILLIELHFSHFVPRIYFCLLSGNGDGCRFSRKLSDQEIGIAKLSGFREWLSIHPIIAELDAEEDTERSLSSHKMIVFAHHHKVLDAVQVRDFGFLHGNWRPIAFSVKRLHLLTCVSAITTMLECFGIQKQVISYFGMEELLFKWFLLFLIPLLEQK